MVGNSNTDAGFKTIYPAWFRHRGYPNRTIFSQRPLGRTRLLFSLCSNSGMTDRPASWRMPTPKQMEKLAAEAARRRVPTPTAPEAPHPDGSGGPPPGEILEPGAKSPSRRRDRDGAATSFQNSAPPAADLLPPLRTDRGNPDRRCSPIVWRQRGLEGRGAAAARQHLPAAYRKARRRRVLAGI